METLVVVSVVVVLVAIAVLAFAGVQRRQELARDRAELVSFLEAEPEAAYEPVPWSPSPPQDEAVRPEPVVPRAAGHRRRSSPQVRPGGSRHARAT